MNIVLSLRGFIAAAALAALTTFSVSGAGADEPSSATGPAKAAPVARAVATTKVRPLSVSVDLLSDTKLMGTLTDATTVEMRTSFGSASIPLSEVAGIRFASADNASTTVVMLNGDSITGATDIKIMTVETEWGIATINGQNIASIMFVPGLSWSPQNGLNGNRWNLAAVKKEVAPKPVAAPQAPASATSRTQVPTRTMSPVYRSR